MSNQETIQNWVKFMINKDMAGISSIVDNKFNIEDGMNLKEYIDYELDNFSRLSPIFDLNNNFKINIIYENLIKDKTTVYFYIVNSKEKIVCKMHLTINNENFKITSNENISQVVPKYVIKNNEVSAYSLAIQSKLEPKYILSKDFSDFVISKSASFLDDGFYSIEMNPTKKMEFNKLFSFKIAYESGQIENKSVFFDIFNPTLCPLKFSQDKIILMNDMYPVGISLFMMDKSSKSYEYPRGLEIDRNDLEYLIVTDSLDNDWFFYFNN